MQKLNIVGHSVLALLTAGLAAAVYLTGTHVHLALAAVVGVLGWAAITLTSRALDSLAGGEDQ